MDVSFRDWAELPAHILDLLVIKLNRYYDYIHFRDVCTKWRYVAIEANVDHRTNFDVVNASRKKLPMLMFKTDENNDEWRSLYNVSDKKTYTIKLPIPYKYRFLGSSRGWLFCVQETMVITLVNPFDNSCISLPVFLDYRKFYRHWQRIYPDFHVRKGMLLSDPSLSPDSFGVLILYRGKLAFFKSGEPSWNLINSELEVSDIIYYKDKLYGISFYGQFVKIDFDSRTIKTITRGTETIPVNGIYLVESQDGELLLVRRTWVNGDDLEGIYVGVPHVEDQSDNEGNNDDDYENYDTDDIPYSDYETVSSDSEAQPSNDVEDINGLNINDDDDVDDDDRPMRSYEFKVFKMTHLTNESPTWVEINNIGEQALFVGGNHSVSVSTTDFPGCMPNSIYYTSVSDNSFLPYSYCGLEDDSGIFNLENRRLFKHHVLGSSYKYMQPPIWFVPNPQEMI